jgi:hypothetical protein
LNSQEADQSGENMCAFRKGSIKIDMPQNTFALHEYINGDVILKLKKPVRARGLSVRLEGKEMVVTDGHTDGESRREWQIFCEETVPLGGDQLYDSGRYEFTIEVPIEASRDLERTKGKAGHLLKAAGGIVGTPGMVEWHLFARLDILTGADLTDKKPIYFRKTGDAPLKSAREELTEVSRITTSLSSRRRQVVLKQQDAPGTEVYGDSVALCPQCDSPYLKKRKPKQCDTCGEFLPEE